MLGLGSASWADLRYFLQTRLKRCLRNECASPAIPMKTYMHAATDADRAMLSEMVALTVVPAWLERCGDGCAEAWNGAMAEIVGVSAE